jgi:8-oxo-dGTP pyrophosphatase MutT (NUDIX family)/sugar/nucleoside kinase (ribokinase family)
MTLPLGKRLVLAGSLGYDVHQVAERDLYVRAGGSAYHAACAALTLQGQALVLATTPRSFNREFLKKFDKTGIKVVDQTLRKGPDNANLFRLDGDGTASGRPVVSLGEAGIPPLEFLEQTPFRDLHIHFGRLPVACLEEAVRLGRRVEPAASFSCHLTESALAEEGSLRAALDVASQCSVVFLNLAAFQGLRARGELAPLLDGRLVMLTSGEAGAICFADGIPCFSHAPEAQRLVSKAGAGDVFAGAFLTALLDSGDLARATVLATELAAASVIEYGSDEVLRLRHSIAKLAARAQTGLPRLAFLNPRDFDGAMAPDYAGVIEATGVFVYRDDRLLLVEKPDHKAFRPGLLYVPGGKLEPGESPEQCARRELAEETGLEDGRFEPTGIFHYPDPRGTGRLYRFYQFRVTGARGEPQATDDISACLWREPAELGRDEVFELTWAQLWLARMTHRLRKT